MKLYDDLQIPKNASQREIQKAYRQLCKLYHPDKAGVESAALFHRIQNAYDILSDLAKRAKYDETGDDGQPGGKMNAIEKECLRGFITFLENARYGIDIFVEMRTGIKRQISVLKDQILTDSGTIDRIAKLRPTIRRKGKASPGASNPFMEALDAKEANLRSQVDGKKAEIADFEKMLDYLEGWESGEKLAPERNSFGPARLSFSISAT